MRVQMSYKILVSVLILITGDYQLLDGSFVSQAPTFQINSTSQRSFYSCKFNVIIDCLWKVDGTTIGLSSKGYTWMTGNGNRTRDCSIIGRFQHTPKLNRNNDKVNVTCTGILLYPIYKIVQIGGSIQLNCSFSQKRNCSWKRDDQVISINGRYKHNKQNDSNVHDCSIQIDNIQRIDLTTWMCLVTATDDEGQHNLTNVYYSLQLNPRADPTDNESTAYADSSTTKRSKGLHTPSDKSSLLTTMGPSTTSDGPQTSPSKIIYTALGVTGTLAVTLAVAVVYQCRRQKHRKNQEPPDEPKHNTTSSTVIKEDFMKMGNPSNVEIPEPTYMNVTSPHLTPPLQLEVPRQEQPISTSTPRPRSNIADNDIQSTEVIYKKVVISRKSTTSLTLDVPHINIGDVAYATILQKRLSQDFSKL